MTADPRPKVLLMGEKSGSPDADASLREVAEVTVIPRGDNEATAKAIREAVQESGPFSCFAVSLICHNQNPGLDDGRVE